VHPKFENVAMIGCRRSFGVEAPSCHGGFGVHPRRSSLCDADTKCENARTRLPSLAFGKEYLLGFLDQFARQPGQEK
jgi:hypothetical protein